MSIHGLIQKMLSIKEKLSETLHEMVEYYSQSHELIKKRQCLQMLLSFNPYSEKDLQMLVLHEIEVGNRIEAIQIYQDFVTLLKEDLNIEPGQSTKELFEILQTGHP